MPKKYLLYGGNDKVTPMTLAVEPKIHALIKAYALENKITIVEATYILMGKGLAAAYGIEDIDQIK